MGDILKLKRARTSLAGAGFPHARYEVPDELRRPSCHLEVLIPSLNEARRLPDTLARTIEYLETQTYSSSLVVIDNGSIDQTVDLASKVRSDHVSVSVIGCAQRGKGAAVRRGFHTSRARFVGYMDADLATPESQEHQ